MPKPDYLVSYLNLKELFFNHSRRQFKSALLEYNKVRQRNNWPFIVYGNGKISIYVDNKKM